MWMHTEGEHCRQTGHNKSRDASKSNYASTDHDHRKSKDGAINAMIPVQQKQLCQKQQEHPQQ